MKAYGEGRRTSPASNVSRSFCPQRDTQTVQRVKKAICPVGVAGDQPELDAAQASRNAELHGVPAPEISGHPVKELPPPWPRHQRQERGVVPDRPLENRRADARGGLTWYHGPFGQKSEDLLVSVEDIEVAVARDGQVQIGR